MFKSCAVQHGLGNRSISSEPDTPSFSRICLQLWVPSVVRGEDGTRLFNREGKCLNSRNLLFLIYSVGVDVLLSFLKYRAS